MNAVMPNYGYPTVSFERGEGAYLFDTDGRRSYATSVAFGPSIGKNIILAYLPYEYCKVGKKLVMEYFNEPFPIEVEAVGYQPLYDPSNAKPKS